ncbi:MAG: DUF899 domain-containing protein [Lysobacterales bacterium]
MNGEPLRKHPDHRIATREQWRAERLELLRSEKELTRRGDELARQRMALPWVRIDKAYRFHVDAGDATLAQLFNGRSQLIVYHFMFGPDFAAGCPSCSAIADGFNGCVAHLEHHDVAFTAVSRAPLAKLQAYKRRMGWSFPWASSMDSDFNVDFAVGLTDAQQQGEAAIEYNYRPSPPAMVETSFPAAVVEFSAQCGTDPAGFLRERPGMSAFVLEDGIVYHTYSTYARGLDALWGMYAWLDRAPRGRNEEGPWWRRHDEYEGSSRHAGCCHRG